MLTVINCKGHNQHVALLVFAGSIVHEPLEKAISVYHEKTGVEVYATYGGSEPMLAQIQISKKGDVYISAAKKFMDNAVNNHVVNMDSRVTLGAMIPVICVKKGNPMGIKNLSDLANPKIRVGIADPGTVAIGAYSKRVFAAAGIKVEPRLVAVSHEALGSALLADSVDVIIAWNVFASLKPGQVDTIPIQPALYGEPSVIEAAVTTYSGNQNVAQNFVNFLASKAGKQIFKSYGFADPGGLTASIGSNGPH